MNANSDSTPQPAADHTVQTTYRIACTSTAQRENGHAEVLLIIARVAAAERHEFFAAQSEASTIVGEVRFDQLGREAIVPRRHGRVRRERHCLGNLLVSRKEVARACAPHPFGGQFERDQRRVSFVQVIELRSGLRPEQPQSLDQSRAADAQQDLLAEPCVPVASIEVASDPAVVLTIPSQIGIEQVQRYTTNLRQPHARQYGAAREWHPDFERHSFGSQNWPKWQRVGLQSIVDFTLPAGSVDRLSEVAIAIQEADADHGHTQVTGRLQVIAGKYAETTRVDG